MPPFVTAVQTAWAYIVAGLPTSGVAATGMTLEAAATAGITAAEGWMAIASVAYTTYSVSNAITARRGAFDAQRASLQDRNMTVRGASNPHTISYGTVRKGADTTAFICQHGDRRQFVTVVLPFTSHAIDGFIDVMFNDTSIFGVQDLTTDLADKLIVWNGKPGYVPLSSPYFHHEIISRQIQVGYTDSPGNEYVIQIASNETFGNVAAVSVGSGDLQYAQTVWYEGVDYSVAGNVITWHTDRTGLVATIVYTVDIGRPLVRVRAYNGDEADPLNYDLIAVSEGKWTLAHKLQGRARLDVTIEWEPTRFGTIGWPNISAIFRGKKVKNLTTNVTEWSENPALCLADYLMSPAGFGLPESRLKLAAVQSAQASCDEDVFDGHPYLVFHDHDLSTGWTAGGLSSATGTAARTCVEDTSGGTFHGLYGNVVSMVAGQPYLLTMNVKRGAGSRHALVEMIAPGNEAFWGMVNLDTGAILAAYGTDVDVNVSGPYDGTYHITVGFTPANGGTGVIYAIGVNAAGETYYTGDGTSSLIWSEPQVFKGSDDQVVWSKRYTCNGVISTASQIRGNVEQLLTSMCGMIAYSGGEVIIRAGVYQAPSWTLEDSDLSESASIQVIPYETIERTANCVRGSFLSPQHNWQVTDFSAYESSAYITEDGGRKRYMDIALPFTNSNRMAQRIGRLMLHQQRQELTVKAAFKPWAMPIQVTDTIYLKISRNGWEEANDDAGKVFRVMIKGNGYGGDYAMSLQEEAEAIYEETYEEYAHIDPAPNINLPDPRIVVAMTDVEFTANGDTYDTYSDGTIMPYILMEWDAFEDDSILRGGSIQVYWHRADQTQVKIEQAKITDTSIKLAPIGAKEAYIVWAVVRNNAGGEYKTVPYTVYTGAEIPDAGRPDPRANQVSNASLMYGYATIQIASSIPVRLSTGDASTWLGGVARTNPSNIILYQENDLQATVPPVLMWPAVPVTPGERWCAAAKVLPVNCFGRVVIAWCDINGNWVSTAEGDDASIDQYESGDATDTRFEQNYEQIVNFGVVPDNIATARFVLIKGCTDSGYSSSSMAICKPQLNLVTAVDTVPPIWTPGGQNSVGTDQIEEGAVTQIYTFEGDLTPSVDTSTASSGPEAGNYQYNFQNLLQFTPAVDCLIEVTLSGEAYTVDNTASGIMLESGIMIAGVDESVNVPGGYKFDGKIIYASKGGNREITRGVLNESGTFTAKAGRKVIINAYSRRYPIAQNPPTGAYLAPAGIDQVRYLKCRATLIKR